MYPVFTETVVAYLTKLVRLKYFSTHYRFIMTLLLLLNLG